MNKYRKSELLEMLKTLIEANDYVAEKTTKDIGSLIEVLTQCQETAVVIGTFIEKTYENIESIVSELESYCENVYQLAVNITDNTFRYKLTKKIRKQLSVIISEIISIIPDDKKVIVFLPYKASMWDSLESVWKAAVDSKECDVFVVPIPYFDKNPDGTLGDFHYEGVDFPPNVPITYWQEFDLETIRPDIIFIHNPYDQFNRVTTVHPDFYSSKIKQYTQCLAYIPYFVTEGDVGRHFCTLPGTVYADVIYVQSEQVKKTYMEELSLYYTRMGMQVDLDKKIQALGSPKFDAVNSKKEGIVEIPEEWKDIIGDHSKKVILYNTHVSCLMQPNGKTFLKKLRSVLELFKNRDDVVLLWRPHPLSLATAQSMNPEIVPEYIEIVEEYKREKYGIYDDTPDMERAIAISDAYYGSQSSLVALYKATGKPIMLQSINVIET